MRRVVRVVVDTNILISGTLVEQGFPAQIIDASIAGQIQLVVSPALIDEYLDVVQRPHIAKRYQEIGNRVDTILRYFHTNAVVVEGAITTPVVTADPGDDFLIACAEEGDAQYIISGDEHLLKLRQYHNVKILNPRDFVARVLSPSVSTGMQRVRLK